jgi:hypothetical protein
MKKKEKKIHVYHKTNFSKSHLTQKIQIKLTEIKLQASIP